MLYIQNAEVKTINVAPGVVQRPLVGAHTGAEEIFMGELEIAVGARVPWHYHTMEDVILVREGKGYVECNPGGKFEVEGGKTSVVVPPNLHHQVVNTGDVPIKIIFGFPRGEIDRIVVEEEYK